MAEPPQDDERRNEDRSPITLRVDYKRLNTFFADYTKNISKGGTFIRTTKPLAVGTRFVFALTLPAASTASDAPGSEGGAETATQSLELTGEVKWVVPEADATEANPAGMGIQFVFISDEERAGVENFVSKLMQGALGPHLAAKLLKH